jgi:hypothetical protein
VEIDRVNSNGSVEHMSKRYLDHSPKSVALVCMGPSTVDYFGPTLTQEFDPDWVDEVWCINMAANAMRCDVVFWMDDLIEQEKFRPNLFKALRRFKVPVVTSVSRPDVVPNSYDYPIEEVGRIGIPVFGKPYLNNGVAMAIGYALWKGVKKFLMFGADFSYPNRDFAESGRGCVESWVTLAATRDMQITISPSSSLMDMVKDAGIYGYREQPEIVLEDGSIFKYVKREDAEIGRYVPEDSSGVKKDAGIPAPVPGARGEPIAAPVAGNPAAQDITAIDAAPAANPPGKGIRRRGRPRRAQAPNPAANGDGRGAGGAEGPAQADVGIPAGPAGP